MKYAKPCACIAALFLAACSTTQTGSKVDSKADKTSANTRLEDCVIQEVLPGKDMTGGFVRFVHQGPAVDIVDAQVPTISQRIELHSMAMKDGVMSMVPLNSPRLEAGERVFKKGADHVMLFDIAQPPQIGSEHTMTVFFSDGTQASCQALVKSLHDVMRDAGLDPKAHGNAPKH